MARTPKGEVAIENVDGWIRLRWRYQGQRKTLSLGLRHDPINMAVAQQRANQIRLDIVSGNYDPTLAKYKTDRSQQAQDIGAVDLFERFIEWKAKRVQPRTLEKYRGLVTWLRDYCGDRPVGRLKPRRSLSGWLRTWSRLPPVSAWCCCGLGGSGPWGKGWWRATHGLI